MRYGWSRLAVSVALLVSGAFACTAVTSEGDAGPPAVEPGDPANDDGGTGPIGSDAGDAGAPGDGGAPAGEILGTLTSGACGFVKGRLAQATPSLDHNILSFVAGETYARTELSPGGQAIFDDPNAGGSSVESEVMSFEVLRFCEGASLLKTETKIGYAEPDDAGANSITDILVSIDGKKVGVSVTRAYKPPSQTLTDADLKTLLEKKLEGVNRSSVRVKPEDKWVKQILHVFAVDKPAADAVARVWLTIDSVRRADTIVLVTQTSGGGFVYCDPDPPLGSECQ